MRTDVRLTSLVASATWIVLHLSLAVMYVDRVRSVSLFVLGVGLFLAASALAVRPLVVPASILGPFETTEPRWVPWVLAASVPVVEAASLLAVERDAVAGYANWAAGGTGVVIAALVFRRHAWLGLVAAAGLVTVQTLVLLDSPVWSVGTAVLLSVPPELWLLAALGVRRVLVRAEGLAADFRARAASEAVLALARADWQRVRTARLRELDAEVLPFLTGLAEGAPLDEAAARRAGLLADELRDGLRARALLTAEVRRASTALRAAGVRVVLQSDLDSGPLVEALRDSLPSVLALDGLASVVIRVSADPPAATAVLSGELVAADVSRAFAALSPPAEVTEGGDCVIVRVEGHIGAPRPGVPG